MNDKLLIALVVLVVLLAHWFLFRWIKFKVDEGVILKFIKESPKPEPDLPAIVHGTQLKQRRVEYVCSKSQSINLP